MRQPVAGSAFDLAINVFTSFGYFEDAADNRLVLENVFGGLRPGGALVLDLLGKELLAAKYQPTRSDELPDGTVLFHRTRIVDDWSRVDSLWTLVEGERATTFPLRHWVYSGEEIRRVARGRRLCRGVALRRLRRGALRPGRPAIDRGGAKVSS